MSRYLIEQNIAILRQGLGIVRELPTFLYTGTMPEFFSGTVGKHIRHIVNFYECFFVGIENGRIDYDARRRDTQVENTVAAAALRIEEIIATLSNLCPGDTDRRVQVHQNEGDEEASEEIWTESTIARELQSIVSHTVHHFAIVGILLRVMGSDCPSDFGVAPSTLKYQRSLVCAPSPG